METAAWIMGGFFVYKNGIVEDVKNNLNSLNNKTSDGYSWVHLNAAHKETKSWLIEETNIDEIWIESLLAKETRPRFVKINEETFFLNIRGINSSNQKNPEDMISIRLYVTKNQIISAKIRHLKPVDKLEKDLKIDAPKSTAEFIIRLIEHINEEIEAVLVGINNEIDQLEEMVLIEHDKDFRQNVIDIRRQMIIFRRYLFPNLEVLHQLSAMNSFFESSAEITKNLLENMNRTTRFTEEIISIKERAQVIHEELNNHLTERLTTSTNKLNAVATIFLPMSFITGLFGVNLGGIPGAESGHSFTIFAIITLVILIIQIFIFRWFRWF